MTLLMASELNWFHNPVEIPFFSMRIVALMLPSAVKMKNCKTWFHSSCQKLPNFISLIFSNFKTSFSLVI